MEEKFYYLRKISELGDRALYKDKYLSRYYRSSYPVPSDKAMKLYTAKRFTTILKHRIWLHDYCGEWFDVYDQDGNLVAITEEEVSDATVQ